MLKQHFEPKCLVIARRFYFHRREQATTESIAEYVAELAAPCNFGAYLNDTLCDRFVCGLCSESTQKRLLSKADLTLTKAIWIAQSMEAAELELHSLRAEKVSIHKFGSGKPNATPPPKKKACHRCGKNNHTADHCFYKEAYCNKCFLRQAYRNLQPHYEHTQVRP